MNSIKYIDLSKISYLNALSIQKKEKERVINKKSFGSIFLLEHDPPVITLGRNANNKNILLPKDIINKNNYEICNTNRGGDVTVHEPGQLVVYFVIPISIKSVKSFVKSIMDKTILLLNDLFNIKANYMNNNPGLWVENRKICSFGFDLRSKVSMHGLAMNVNNSLLGFKFINPCGLNNVEITSIAKEIKNSNLSNLNNKANVSYLVNYIVNNRLYF